MSVLILAWALAASRPDAVVCKIRQVTPLVRDWPLCTRSQGRTRAVVLLHGLELPPLHRGDARTPEFDRWQKPGSRLVKGLAAHADIYALARQVPHGRVTTYGAIARALGLPNGARQVGWAMAVCPDDVPAHRVINASGKVSGSPEGSDLRRAMLEDEGVEVRADGSISLRGYLWEP